MTSWGTGPSRSRTVTPRGPRCRRVGSPIIASAVSEAEGAHKDPRVEGRDALLPHPEPPHRDIAKGTVPDLTAANRGTREAKLAVGRLTTNEPGPSLYAGDPQGKLAHSVRAHRLNHP